MDRKIGAFLLELRKEKGMTQKEVAELLHVSDKTVSRWERNEGVPDLFLVPELAALYGVTSDELLLGEKKLIRETDVEILISEEEFISQSKQKFVALHHIFLGMMCVGTAITAGLVFWDSVKLYPIDLSPLYFLGILVLIVAIVGQVMVGVERIGTLWDAPCSIETKKTMTRYMVCRAEGIVCVSSVFLTVLLSDVYMIIQNKRELEITQYQGTVYFQSGRFWMLLLENAVIAIVVSALMCLVLNKYLIYKEKMQEKEE